MKINELSYVKIFLNTLYISLHGRHAYTHKNVNVILQMEQKVAKTITTVLANDCYL